MKKFSIITIAFFAALLLLNACKKTGGNINPLADVANLSIGSYLVLDSTISSNLNTASSTSKIGIVAHQYAGGEAIDRVVIYAVLGTSTDTTQWKLVKSVPYTAGSNATLSVSTAELGTAYGVNPSTFTAGSQYTFFTRIITKSGKKYDINNAGDNGGGGLITGPNYKSAFSFSAYVVCPFTGSMTGTYEVKRDDWVDWLPGDEVTVTDGPGANQINLSAVWPNPDYGDIINPLIVSVDPSNGVASSAKINFGAYPAVASVNSCTGYVFSCTGFITLSFDFVYAGASQGQTKLILQKK